MMIRPPAYFQQVAGGNTRMYLASATYHCYHISLLRSLAPLYPALRFGEFADRWAGYATRAGTKCPATTPTG